MAEFSAKVVVVTGASAGIGEATALEFARRGASLLLVGRAEVALRAVAERCAAAGSPDVLAVVADVSTDEGVQKIVQETLDRFGRSVWLLVFLCTARLCRPSWRAL